MKNQRMLDELTELMRIDVSSGQEMEIADCLAAKLEQMGFSGCAHRFSPLQLLSQWGKSLFH